MCKRGAKKKKTPGKIERKRDRRRGEEKGASIKEKNPSLKRKENSRSRNVGGGGPWLPAEKALEGGGDRGTERRPKEGTAEKKEVPAWADRGLRES